jgi:ZIP family zinc transporter
MLVSGVSAALGYGLLSNAPEEVEAGCQAFAAGAILTMLADTMMPEAVEEGGPVAGLVTVLGFAIAFLLSKL